MQVRYSSYKHLLFSNHSQSNSLLVDDLSQTYRFLLSLHTICSASRPTRHIYNSGNSGIPIQNFPDAPLCLHDQKYTSKNYQYILFFYKNSIYLGLNQNIITPLNSLFNPRFLLRPSESSNPAENIFKVLFFTPPPKPS